MTHARIYQQGVKAFLDAKPLESNPYDSPVNSEAHEAWKDGWLDANHSSWRRHAFHTAMRAYIGHRGPQNADARRELERTILKGRPATPVATCGFRDSIPSHPDQTEALGA